MYITQQIYSLCVSEQCESVRDKLFMELISEYEALHVKLTCLKLRYERKSREDIFPELSIHKKEALTELQNRLRAEERIMENESRPVSEIVDEIYYNYPVWCDGIISHRVRDFVEELCLFQNKLSSLVLKYLEENSSLHSRLLNLT